MDRSVERATQNEVRFREANETIEERRVELGVDGVRVPYLCECEDPSCREILRLTADEYRGARESDQHFLLASGHPYRSGSVVAENDGYVVVKKTGAAAEVIAREESGRG
jgi:hypothetical protein